MKTNHINIPGILIVEETQLATLRECYDNPIESFLCVPNESRIAR